MQFSALNRAEIYAFVAEVLKTSQYSKMRRKQKGIVRTFLQKMCGYERAQITRLIGTFIKAGRLTLKPSHRPKFPLKYSREDVLLLAETDRVHSILSGPATLAIMKREYGVFGRLEFKQLSSISISHLYNLRKHFIYREKLQHFEKTKPNKVTLGERRKPCPEGMPGFIRVDTVHQGDFGDLKGVYHINLVDETTQCEIIVSVEKISEQYLLPALEAALKSFPFTIFNFHADNGSEYINKFVAELLQKMLIKLTKSRPRHSGDNGLVECKNGAIIRKQLGYAYIPQMNARIINKWMQDFLNPYNNFHRPCAFPFEKMDGRGKVKKTYPKEFYKTPYEKLKSLNHAEQYLKPGMTFAELDKLAYSLSDNEAAKIMIEQKQILFSRLSFPSS